MWWREVHKIGIVKYFAFWAISQLLLPKSIGQQLREYCFGKAAANSLFSCLVFLVNSENLIFWISPSVCTMKGQQYFNSCSLLQCPLASSNRLNKAVAIIKEGNEGRCYHIRKTFHCRTSIHDSIPCLSEADVFLGTYKNALIGE